jgi:glutaminase
MATNDRNLGSARLLSSYGRMYCDPRRSHRAEHAAMRGPGTATDLAIMGATLANGETNPATQRSVITSRELRPGAFSDDGQIELSGSLSSRGSNNPPTS